MLSALLATLVCFAAFSPILGKIGLDFRFQKIVLHFFEGACSCNLQIFTCRTVEFYVPFKA
jgi:hypothetical protein